MLPMQMGFNTRRGLLDAMPPWRSAASAGLLRLPRGTSSATSA
jgi:hypothetical protein